MPAARATSDSRHLQADVVTLSGNVTTVPLFTGVGSHYAWMFVGTPPQRVSLTVSTRSSVMALPCSSTTTPFSAVSSSTYSQTDCDVASSFFQCKRCDTSFSGCEISQTYVTGSSYSARIAEDFLYLAGEEGGTNGSAGSSSGSEMKSKFGTSFMFGCRFRETGLFTVRGIDGLLGLSNSDNSLVAKLHYEKKIPQKLFSLCLTPDGGSMTLGAVDTSRHDGDVAYAKLAPDPLNTNFFNVLLTDVQVGSASVQAPSAAFTRGLFTVDSGTAHTYLPASMKEPFEQAFQQATGFAYESSDEQCGGYSDEQVAQFPVVRLALEAAEDDGGDLLLELTPQQYLVFENERYCGGFFFTEDHGGILGANVLLHRDVIFDGESDRIGFAAANCTFTAFPSSLANETASSSASGTAAAGSPFVDGSKRNAGNSSNGSDSDSADALLASAAQNKSHITSMAISIACIVFVLLALAVVYHRRRNARQARRTLYGDMQLVRVFDDDDDGYPYAASGEFHESRGPKESFVTPHFLLQSPPMLTARSPRSPRSQQQLGEEEARDDEATEARRLAHERMMLFDRKARESRRSSQQRVEL